RAVAVSGERLAQGVRRAAVLQQQGGRHRRVAGVCVNGCPVLAGSEEDLSEGAVLEPADAGRIPDPFVLEGQELVSAAVWELLARHIRPPQLRSPIDKVRA